MLHTDNTMMNEMDIIFALESTKEDGHLNK